MWIGKFQIWKKYPQVSHYKMSTPVLGSVVQLVECLPLFQEALVQSPVLYNLGMVVKASNLSLGMWRQEDQKFKVSLIYKQKLGSKVDPIPKKLKKNSTHKIFLTCLILKVEGVLIFLTYEKQSALSSKTSVLPRVK